MALFFWPPRLPASDWFGDPEWPGWGFTHTQFSADDGDPAAVDTAQAAIKSVPMVQAQAIMGWGVDNPEPSPGSFDFRTLDRRMEFIRRSGGVPVIVLCCAPDWMKGGEPGQTDWDRLEDAPRPEHFADFAALGAEVARRYPYVRHFLVWNEFKGFFNHQRKRWEAPEYVDLFNAVYDALKEVNPANQVGGPYLDFAQPFDESHSSPYLRGPWGSVDQRVLEAFVYWAQHRKGADFVVVDGHATTGEGNTDEFTALEKFAAVDTWLQSQVDLPIWWAEWYVEGSRADWSDEHKVALRVAAMIELAGSGAYTALYWNPRPGEAGCATCLWTDTRMADGGEPLPFLTDFLQRFVRSFPPGVDRRKLYIADGLIALASDRARVIVNTTDKKVRSVVDGRQIEFSAYETRWITAQP
ncbi:xylan 1,4-beta-xylosidase [Mycolicibacterium boenickei]|nr:xylan 1,4-beta-xylosidase [Mycolicibacterium boenickei]